MTRSMTFIAVACACVMSLLGAAGANAKGGSPGYHSFTRQHATVLYPCAVHPSGHTARACLAQVYYRMRADTSR
jgi:hypothetical protein